MLQLVIINNPIVYLYTKTTYLKKSYPPAISTIKCFGIALPLAEHLATKNFKEKQIK